jgi:hypothetical protein
MINWISVKDRLPDCEIEVIALCWKNEEPFIRQLDYNGHEWRGQYGEVYIYLITHWAEINLPEEKK